MLPRVLEPEVMDTAEEAADYDAMDHRAVNNAFCIDFLELAGKLKIRRVLDVGTGTGLIPIELCSRAPAVRVVAVDLAAHMLDVARANVEHANLQDRISLELRDAKSAGWPDGEFDAVISNSIVHHIPDPADALGEMWRLVGKGGALFVRDLFRPKDDVSVEALVERYAPIGDDRDNRQRALFEASLRAALTPSEVVVIADRAEIRNASISISSDRHWTLFATRAAT
ncbi:MAG: class I SAM-dependent methyltransferase [Polyangiaceae bacterium]